MKTFNYIINIIAIVLVIDFVCAVGWAMSGQVPADSFFIGSITKHTLQAIFF